jgi:hypothetical protein
MTTYPYRCQLCGVEVELEQPMDEPVPELVHQFCHFPEQTVVPSALASWALTCFGDLKRVYTMPRTNLGYRSQVHTQDDRYRFMHL